MSSSQCDVLVVGAGPVGAIAARFLAENDLHCVVIDKRKHVAGNCYDETDRFGVLVHRYGPHYFRTNSDELVEFLSRFTDWVPGKYVVKSQVRDRLYPFPINLETLEAYFGMNLDENSAQELLENERVPLAGEPRNSEEFVLSRVGQKLFDDFYLGYTQKQWEKHPRDLAPSVCGRIPVRLNRNSSYVDHKHQILPKHGFTQMFQNILSHPKIELITDCSYQSLGDRVSASLATLYTGPLEEYFGKRFGPLPWRSLEFDFQNFEEDFVQPCVQINYPGLDVPYTRSVELKHATGQDVPSTTVCYEYSRSKGEPFYPIPAPESHALYEKYKDLADEETRKNHVYFAGRLAEYTYINTDEAIERGLKVAKEIWDLNQK